jgi:hypothetical protein
MGLLDDAIREHLELKRKHGTAPDELAKQEAEAFGPVRREPAAEPVAAPGAEELVEEPAAAESVEEEPYAEEPVAEELDQLEEESA